MNYDYAGSALQRMRTQDILGRSILNDDYNPPAQRRRRRFGLKPDAGATLSASQKKVSRVSLAAWLGRNKEFEDIEGLADWFVSIYPLAGTDLSVFYTTDIPGPIANLELPFTSEPVENEALISHFGVALPSIEVRQEEPAPSSLISDTTITSEEGLSWTREVCEYTLSNPDPQAITEAVLADLAIHYIELPDAEDLVRRCVTALLVGHLILSGPPGTGKTTLGRAPADFTVS